MVQDTLDEYDIVRHAIEDSVAAMQLAARAFPIIGAGLPGQWKTLQLFEHVSETSHVVGGDFIAKAFGAVIVDPRQIAARGGAQPDPSHAGRGAR